jgi:hypothetical protein
LVTLSDDDDEISPKKDGSASLPHLEGAINEFQGFEATFFVYKVLKK